MAGFMSDHSGLTALPACLAVESLRIRWSSTNTFFYSRMDMLIVVHLLYLYGTVLDLLAKA